MNISSINLVLADDDSDDCILFKEVLSELPFDSRLTIVHDGVQLMNLLLKEETTLPHLLYLDLNMPLKNGFDCLTEIKLNKKLKQLPVIIFSTSFNPKVANEMQQNGAKHYIQKPAEFDDLKKIIYKSLSLISGTHAEQNTKDTFLLVP